MYIAEDTTNKSLLGSRIRELRKNLNMRQDELATLVGIDQRHMSRIECGYNSPSFDTLERIAISLKVPIKALFDHDYLDSREKLLDRLMNIIHNADLYKLRVIYRLVFSLE